LRRELLAVMVTMALVAGSLLPLLAQQAFRWVGTGVPTATPAIPSIAPTATAVPVPTALPEAMAFRGYEELLEFLENVSKARQSLSSTYSVVRSVVQPVYAVSVATVVPLATAIPSTYGAKSGTEVPRTPGTNVQVLGVDEPDIVKCDGRLLVVASNTKVFIVGVSEKKVLSVLRFEEPVSGLYLTGGTLVVTTQSYLYRPLEVRPVTTCDRCVFVLPAGTANTTIHVYSVSNPANPEHLVRISVSGTVVSSRLSKNFLYLVTTLPIDGNVVPLVNGEAIPPTSVVAVDPDPTAYTTVLAVDISGLKYAAYAFMTGYSSWLYMSTSRLYIASARTPSMYEAYRLFIATVVKYLPEGVASEVSKYLGQGEIDKCLNLIADYLKTLSREEFESLMEKVSKELGSVVFRESTKFYVFSVDGVKVAPSGSFEVDGRILDQFSMEEMGDYFVTATTSGNWKVGVEYRVLYIKAETPPSGEKEVVVVECRGDECWKRTITITMPPGVAPYTGPAFYVYVAPAGNTENNVFVADLKNMKIVGELRGLAEGERIYSARLIKNILFLVTFRQVDPLFAIDLNDPANPKVLGYLKIPGFSDYLHPLPGDMMLGIGMEDGMLKLSLYNVSNPAKMSEVAKIKIPGWSVALQDHHAVTVDLDNELVMIPASIEQASGVLVVSYRSNALTLVKFIEHAGAVRTTYVGNELYTVSADLVKVFNIADLTQKAEIALK